jgi:Carboxypeptidase regulatory-like domain/TonB-dependent Receptor Plug Domain
MKLFRAVLLLAAAVLFMLNAVPLMAQSSTTGGLTGTVTDPSGAVISGATVTVTNLGTGQTRTVTTDANGSYKLNQLEPGNYSVTFSASGFKSLQIPSITVSITETSVVNRSLEVGAQTQQVTVEATSQTIQTQNATVGTLVGARTVTTLPLSSRNYTNIIDLSPGVVVNVASAAAVGNGTQDINVNGNGSDQNNYMMDGATITNYGSGGGAQSGNFPGIAIPNPDSIEEFKIQTSQYDAEYGRNPGASVNVTTKDGTNKFHGDVWEFFRNSALDGNDFFNKFSQKALGEPNKPETLNENMFGGTIGGPIKKDKIFFFGSYQGFRQLNAVGTNGFATGLSTGITLYPFTAPGSSGGRGNSVSGTIPLDYVAGNAPCSYATYRQYLGCAFGGITSSVGVLGTQVPVATNGSNINQIAINMLQWPGPKGGINQGFYFPGAPFQGNGLPVNTSSAVIAQPTRANEDQVVGNIEYVVNSKNTLFQKFFYSRDPQDQSFVCLGSGCAPGAPEDVKYGNINETVKLTTVATSNFVNEALFSYIRESQLATPGNYISACQWGVIPPQANGNCANLTGVTNISPIVVESPTVGIAGVPVATPGCTPFVSTPGFCPLGYGQGGLNVGGNFFASGVNTFNTFEGKDNISWTHGRHTFRTGFEVDRLQYNVASLSRGGYLFPTIGDFLTSSSGSPATGTPTPTSNGILANFFGLSSPIGNPLGLRSNEFAAYVEDDIKATSKLTLNLGVRWEYDGYPTSVDGGVYSNGWLTLAGQTNTGSFFLGNEATTGTVPCPGGFVPFCPAPAGNNNLIGTLVGSVVPSNYNPNYPRCGVPFALSGCGYTAPTGVFPGYPGGATGVFTNNNSTLVHGAPLNDFGPRVGLAWEATNNLVVRAGYGIFYDAVYANLLADNQEGNPPYNGYANTSFPGNSLDLPLVPGLSQGTILGWTPRTLQVLGGSPATGATLIEDNSFGTGLGTTSDNEFLSVPLIQQYNLDLQYQVARNWVLDLGYVGSHGTHLYDWARSINVAFLAPNAPNEPAATDLQNSRMIIGSGATGTPNALPFNDVANTSPTTRVLENTGNSAFYQGNSLGRVSYLGYGTGGLSTTSTAGDSLYNSLQAQIRHQFSNGLMLQASYTWSKLITNVNASEGGAGIAAPGNVLSGGGTANDPLDLGQQYGLAAFNRPQRLIIAYSYDLPYKNTHGFVGHALGGWTVSGVTTIQDGEPFTVTDGNAGTIYFPTGAGFGIGARAELNPANTGKCNQYGVCQGFGLTTSGSNYSRVVSGLTGGNGWINAAAYTDAPCIGGVTPGDCAGSGGGIGWGNSGTGQIMGPGQDNWDLSLIKNTKITEGTSLEFRVEFYNIWNHAQFSNPVNSRNSSTFGQIASSSVPPRIMQFALKFYF